MRKTEIFLVCLTWGGFVGGVQAAYSKRHRGFENSNFFDSFDFYTDKDPTKGVVDYVDRNEAQNAGLIGCDKNGSVYVGVDHTNPVSQYEEGRKSVRLESKDTFNHGLFLLDIEHMPFGCGSWPAFWTLGTGSEAWPNYGEIDIIEGVHNQNYNKMALHTKDGCQIYDPLSAAYNRTRSYPPPPFSDGFKFRGKVADNLVNCYVDSPGNNNRGCAIHDEQAPWGWYFNKLGGGMYAMEWTKDFIKIWTWQRDEIPADAKGDRPEPLNWGTPSAIFWGSCNIDKIFKDHKIIFNITFCGDWAGNDDVWRESGCPAAKKYTTCEAFVRDNPSAFRNTYWKIRSLRVWDS